MRTILDIPYLADTPHTPATRQALDVYAPDSGTNLPVVVYIHGGGWRYGDRKDVGIKPAALVNCGFIFVSLGYRLVPEVRNRGQLADLATGLRWVYDHIAQYGGARDQLHLLGWSAGAPLAASVAVDRQHINTAGVPASAIRTVTGLDGDCFHIPRQIEMTDAKTRAYHESVWGTDPAAWNEPSPITHLAPGEQYPAFLLIHIASRADSRWQAEAFASRCHAVGANARVLAIDTTHEALTNDIGRDGDPTTAAVLEFIAPR